MESIQNWKLRLGGGKKAVIEVIKNGLIEGK